jgi:SAM-dependent methyltransferase
MSDVINYISPGHPLNRVRSRYAYKARKRIYDLFTILMLPTPSSSILDLGVTPDRTLPESNFFEKLYPYKYKITAASIEDASFLEKDYPGLRFVKISPDALPFRDNEFDILFCSAVIEHVGEREAQKVFIKEALRVARAFYFTTPNRQFPLEFHTFLPFVHWLPQRAHQTLLRYLGLNFWAKTVNLNLLTPHMFIDLFPPCKSLHLFNFRLFGLPSNIIIYGDK